MREVGEGRRKRALVTGAAQGIGRSISDRLEAEGLEVVRLDLAGEGVVRCDVSNYDEVERVAEVVGPIDVLVNNAGIWRYAPLENVEPQEFRRVVEVNLFGPFYMTQVFGKGMLERRRGSIVNVVSISAVNASPRVGAYGPSKAALIALTRQTAVDWGSRGVRCNAVGPGLIVTPGTQDVYDDAGVTDRRSAAVPLGRMGTPADIAEVVAFLASDAAGYVTGQVVFVDGGFTHSLMELLPR
jgi:NAD(P)-dependent dehydrogenase (short-subunit alcohol dehydrogenase family)